LHSGQTRISSNSFEIGMKSPVRMLTVANAPPPRRVVSTESGSVRSGFGARQLPVRKLFGRAITSALNVLGGDVEIVIRREQQF